MSTTTTAETGEFTVTDELYEISEATNPDGTVDVTVYDFSKTDDGEKVEVYFHTPSMKKKSEKMDWPRMDSPKYKFVRLCRKTVGGLNGAEWLKQDGAEIKADPDDWEIKASLSKRDKLKSFIKKVTIKQLLAVMVGLVVVVWMLMLSVVSVGLPILWFLSLFGGATLFAGALKAWVVAIIVLYFSMMVVGPMVEE